MFEQFKVNLDLEDDSDDNDVDLDFLKAGKDNNFDNVLKDLNKFSDDIMYDSKPKQFSSNSQQNEKYQQEIGYPGPLTQQIKENDKIMPNWKSERDYEKALDKIDKLYGKIMEPRFVDKPKEKNNEQFQQIIEHNQLRNSDEIKQQIYDQGGFNYPSISQFYQNSNCQVNAPIQLPIQPNLYQPIPFQNQQQPNILPYYYQGIPQPYQMAQYPQYPQYPIGMPINSQNQNYNGQQEIIYGQPI